MAISLYRTTPQIITPGVPTSMMSMTEEVATVGHLQFVDRMTGNVVKIRDSQAENVELVGLISHHEQAGQSLLTIIGALVNMLGGAVIISESELAGSKEVEMDRSSHDPENAMTIKVKDS